MPNEHWELVLLNNSIGMTEKEKSITEREKKQTKETNEAGTAA